MLRAVILSVLGPSILLAQPRAESAPPLADSVAPGTNRHFSYSVTAPIAAHRVWTKWMDVGGWPAWDQELRSAAVDAPLAAGVRGRLIPVRGRAASFRVTEFIERSRYAFVTGLPLASLTITRSLIDHGDSTTFTHDVRFDGFLGRVFAAKFGPAFRRALPRAMLTLAASAADSTHQPARQP
jgi:Polyketide cyclase / dehydrase and lipid transport